MAAEITQSDVLNLFDLIGAVTNNDFVLMQISSGAAKKVNTQVLAAYLGQIAIGFIANATDQQVAALFDLLEAPTAAQGANSSVNLAGLYKFLTEIRQELQDAVDGMATAASVTTALENIRQELASSAVPHVSLTETAYEELVENNEVDPDTIYLTYEE